MRHVQHPQRHFGQVDIAEIAIDPRSRDDIPALLKGLQHLYVNDEIRKKVFAILENTLGEEVNREVGRPGMELWKIFVLGTLKLGMNCDYDRLQELANQHSTLRQMLGHSDWTDTETYALQTLIDNVSKLTPAILSEINQVVVEAGHALLKKKSGEILKGRCDSFVVETDVHYPTDTNLLWDAMRKLLTGLGRACDEHGISGWRQYQYNLRQLKKRFRKTQKLRHSNSKDETKRAAKRKQINAAYEAYLASARTLVTKAEISLESLAQQGHVVIVTALQDAIRHAVRQIDQIERRVLKGEVIPHEEKVFSLFEEHTEWICKGKAGVPVELGVRVCVLEDQHQFILHHQIMWKETDDKIAISMVEGAQDRYPDLRQCSFDKGFYTPTNRDKLDIVLDHVILPRKGRLTEQDKQHEYSEDFILARHQHSAVESCINNLEQRGLDRCLSYGRHGFERHVALSIVACNLHRIGLLLQRQERARLQKEKRKRQRLAA
ncbi:MAG: ISNCY family transposase [Pseudomonadales bacterium]